MDFYGLPNDIISLILYNYLAIDDIGNCLKCNKLFHVLNEFQLNIIKNATKGFKTCLLEGHLESAKWIYERELSESINILLNEDIQIIFEYCCKSPNFETVKWIYDLSAKLGNPVNMTPHPAHPYLKSGYSNILYSTLHECKSLETFIFLYSFLEKYKLFSNKYLFRKNCLQADLSIIKWIYNHCLEINDPIVSNDINCLFKDSSSIFLMMIHSSNLEKIKWIYDLINQKYHMFLKSYEMYKETFIKLCQNATLDVVKWLYDIILNDLKIVLDQDTFSDLWIASCCNGNFETTEWIYEICNNSRCSLDIINGFKLACKNVKNPNIKLVKWIYSLIIKNYQYYEIIIQDQYFIDHCKLGNLEMAKFLYNLSLIRKYPIDIHQNNEIIFKLTCQYGKLDVAKWLYHISISINSKINIHHDNEDAFISSCRHGHLYMAQWLYNTTLEENDPIDIYADTQYAFKWACINAHESTIIWLYDLSVQLKSPYDLRCYDDYLFRTLVEHGNLKLVKWFYQKSIEQNYPINLRFNDDNLIKFCFKTIKYDYKYIKIMKWLASLCTHYQLYQKNGKLIGYDIYTCCPNKPEIYNMTY